MNTKLCPCGSSSSYEECCEPYIRGLRNPPSAEALMRSRYTAYVKHEIDYIMKTCTEGKGADIDLNQTRKWSEDSEWQGLKILASSKGGSGDSEGTVEFIASYVMRGLLEHHHEQASFVKRNGIWLYDDGKIIPETVMRQGPKTGRNEPCPCGSGKKYKQCCGR